MTDWFDLLAVQGTLKSLLQHHSSKASILQCSVFFMVQLSHPYMTTGETIALTIQNFVGKVMSLLLNMLSRFVIAFSSKEQASFNFMAAVTIHSDFGAQENKICHCFHFPPSICHEVMVQMPWSSFFECLVLSQLFYSSVSPSSRQSLVPLSLSTIRVVSSAYLRLLIFLPEILIPACASSSPAFHMMYYA